MESVNAIMPYRDINVKISDNYYSFSSPSSPHAQHLVIDRATGELRLQDAAAMAATPASQVLNIAGILGTIQLRLDKYVIFITKATPVGRLKGHMVYKVSGTQVLPMRRRQIHDPDEDTFLKLLENTLSGGAMYFSYSLDLTNSFQRQAEAPPSTPMWARADERFFWNRFVSSDLINFRRSGPYGRGEQQPGVDPFILPVMYGMVSIRPTEFSGRSLTMVLISRRCNSRTGTRFFTRGLDQNGNPANYNETEQVVVLDDNGSSNMGGFEGTGNSYGSSSAVGAHKEAQLFSYLQIRGSVPAFWAEVNDLKYTPKIQLTSSLNAAVPAASKHISDQISLYGSLFMINLINQKGREKQVKDWFEQMVSLVKASDPRRFENFHYVYFDFHHETKGMKMENAYRLVDRMEARLQEQAYFRAGDAPGSKGSRLEVRQKQQSIMRTNCMDCLDRTNVVQSMFARYMLNRILVDADLMPAGATFTTHDPKFEELFRDIWGDNADMVSKTYSGTGAMKTDVTRMGKRTKKGPLQDGVIGVTRYFLNNFMDGPRQDGFDLFLGNYLPGSANIGSALVFSDRRPVLIQAVPYLLGFSVMMLFLAYISSRGTLAMRFFSLVWLIVAGWSTWFVKSNGKLYVNWPKLCPQQYAIDGFNQSLAQASKDPIIGPYLQKNLARHERNISVNQWAHVEEGKKRIE